MCLEFDKLLSLKCFVVGHLYKKAPDWLRLQSVGKTKFAMKVITVVLLLCALYAAATAVSKDEEIMEVYKKNPTKWNAIVSSTTNETLDDIQSVNLKSSGFQSREAVK